MTTNTLTSKKIRSGLYEVQANGTTYRIEDFETENGWTWRVTDPNNYFDGWFGDFDTKREALAAIAATTA